MKMVKVALIGVVFVRCGVGGRGLVKWEEFGDFTGGLCGPLSHHQSVAHPQELWMVEEPAADTGFVSFLQTLLRTERNLLHNVDRLVVYMILEMVLVLAFLSCNNSGSTSSTYPHYLHG